MHPRQNNHGDGYDIGDEVVVECVPLGMDDAPVSPATAACVVIDPDGAITTLTYGVDDEATRETDVYDPGDVVYRFRYLTSTAGRHRYRVTTTGEGAAVEQGSFLVRPLYT